MREEPAPPRKTGGLASCDGCLDVVPAARLVAIGSRLVCEDCSRKFAAAEGGDGGDAAGADGTVPPLVPRGAASPARGGPPPVSRPQSAATPYVGPPARTIRTRAGTSGAPAPSPTAETSGTASAGRGGPVIRTTHRSPFEKSRQADDAAPASESAAAPAAAASPPRTVPSRFGGGFGAGNGTFMGPTSPPSLTPPSPTAPPPWAGDVSAPPQRASGSFAPPVPPVSPSQHSAPPVRRSIPGFPHLDEKPSAPPPLGGAAASPAPASGAWTPDRGIGGIGGSVPTDRPTRTPSGSALDRPRSAAAATPSVASGAGPSVRTPSDGAKRGPSEAAFAEYAELRQRIDQGEDTLELRRRAGELASRLSLQIEAIDHYRRCTELAPADEKLRATYENVRRSAPTDRGGPAETPAEPGKRLPEEEPPFWTELSDVMAYPVAGRGASVLVAGGIFFAIADVLRTVNPFGWALSIMIAGYCACYLFDVINATGAGKRALPQMPEFASFLESYVSPAWSLFVCGAISFAPFAVAAWLALGGVVPSPVGGVLCLITFAVGAFAMPMTLMIRAMFQNWSEPLNPGLVLGSIGRIFPDYLAAYVALSVLWVGYAVASAVVFGLCWLTLGLPTADAILAFDFPRIASWLLCTFLSWPLFLYTWTLHGHILGRTYRQGLRRLGWFVTGAPEARVARRMSVALIVGAVAATGLLCGAAWGVSKAFSTMAAGSAGSLMTKSPVKDGSRLTYFWQNTDGAAGLTTYCFDAAAGGKLRVSAVVRLANSPDRCAAPEDLGVMDPLTGTFVSAAQTWGPGVSHEGRRGEHVPFYGPTKAAVGATYLNEWLVRGADRWRGAWQTWRVQYTDPVRPSADLYFDTRSGVLVGRKYGGMGFVVTEWLVAAKNVAGVTAGPPPEYDFGTRPLDWLGDGGTDGGTDGIESPGGYESLDDALRENR